MAQHGNTVSMSTTGASLACPSRVVRGVGWATQGVRVRRSAQERRPRVATGTVTAGSLILTSQGACPGRDKPRDDWSFRLPIPSTWDDLSPASLPHKTLCPFRNPSSENLYAADDQQSIIKARSSSVGPPGSGQRTSPPPSTSLRRIVVGLVAAAYTSRVIRVDLAAAGPEELQVGSIHVVDPVESPAVDSWMIPALRPCRTMIPGPRGL